MTSSSSLVNRADGSRRAWPRGQFVRLPAPGGLPMVVAQDQMRAAAIRHARCIAAQRASCHSPTCCECARCSAAKSAPTTPSANRWPATPRRPSSPRRRVRLLMRCHGAFSFRYWFTRWLRRRTSVNAALSLTALYRSPADSKPERISANSAMSVSSSAPGEDAPLETLIGKAQHAVDQVAPVGDQLVDNAHELAPGELHIGSFRGQRGQHIAPRLRLELAAPY